MVLDKQSEMVKIITPCRAGLLQIGYDPTVNIQETCEIGNGFYVIGSVNVPVYLLDGPVPVLFDAGMTTGTFINEAGIRKVLGGSAPEYLRL